MSETDTFLAKFADIADKQNRIPPELYGEYSVKRGLRNNDGTGVLVGLTEIGQVHGYIIDEGERTPVSGVLSYRGMDIRDIVSAFQDEKRFGFEETAFLLLFGNLPSKQELDDFTRQLGFLRTLPEHFTEDVILKVPSENLMNKMARAVLSLYSFDPSPDSIETANLLRQSVQLISRFPLIAAYTFQAKNHYLNGASLFIHAPDKNKGTAENLLMLIREDQSYSELEAEILDLALVLHAEHGGGNNSAFTTHVVSSTGTDTYSAISAAIGSLKGPLHGGAAEKARIMMQDIMDKVRDWTDEEEVSDYIVKILRKEAFDRRGLVYGMGHAVYTKSDPRAELLKKKIFELSNSIGLGDEFRLYEIVEKVTPRVFSEVTGKNKDISANVDFYSGFAYSCLNIPRDLFTVLFAVSRIVGWCAHRIEETLSGGRIIRPAYRSITKSRPYTPLAERS
ncbi:Citrate synthase (si) [Olavius algarvensis spirochete endosymbiont]|uniref:citrate/2-methylcitrate synthase n=1 Tax=Olavius algarvensis spirochete endosymbiont TaxID=260710 RepID=UPI000F159CA9|nr:citrate/2-methylcitrate synthase [Olavius algarvensis spirochete endosymbiont]VDB00349.1 Citrate synthase (si) [Olavius algarvensis spirochete endosymbiont]